MEHEIFGVNPNNVIQNMIKLVYSNSNDAAGPIIDIYPCEISWIDLLLCCAQRLPAAG